jgi:aspartate ammonia-lyase
LKVLTERTVEGLRADERARARTAHRSTAVATALGPYIGYAATAEIGQGIRQDRTAIAALHRPGAATAARDNSSDDILVAEAMTSPGIPGRKDAP